MKYSACIEMLFTEYPFLERIRRAKANGFTHVEFWLWQGKELEGIGEALQKNGMKLGVFQGNTRGRMVDPADHQAYCDGVRESIEVAKRLGAEKLFCMTDILREDRTVEPARPPHTLRGEGGGGRIGFKGARADRRRRGNRPPRRTPQYPRRPLRLFH